MKNRSLLSIVPLVLALTPSMVHAQSSTAAPTPPLTRPRTVTATPPIGGQQRGTVAPTPTPTPLPPARQVTPTATPAQQTAPTLSIAPAPSTTPVPVAPVVLQPVRPLSVNKVRERINEAQRQLKTRLVPTAMGPSLYLVTLAALDPDTSQVHLLTLPKQTFLRKDNEVTMPTSLGTLVRVRIMRSNYVNTAVVISDLSGRQLVPLVVEYPIEKGGTFREMAYYTSAHPALLSPELVKAGQSYVRTMIDLAAKRLKDKGIIISPSILDIAERLCIVEHVDHDRFRRENRIALYEEIYALYALNELNTYRYSVSSAGAGGMVQMIPWTYQMIRQHHPGVGLNPDFVFGMRNHGNALEAMLLYMRDTWSDLSVNLDVTYAMKAGWATQADIMAAGYNSNPARLPLYIQRGGADWRLLIPRETQMYLQIYRSVDTLMPIKARAEDSKQ